MYAAHQGGQSVRTLFSAPTVTYNVGGKPATLWGLQGSASLNGKQLVLTVVNPHHEQAREAEIAVRGATVRGGNVRTLSSTDIHAHNSFANPHALEPKDAELSAAGQTIVFQFPPASVTRLLLTLT
ncbi:MAG: hypothetical protein DMF68_15400 [Acidobacteria bacterium]|nr:MAG: hypothetical protein DMF68_15400 [Acidobacteriota bacterium]